MKRPSQAIYTRIVIFVSVLAVLAFSIAYTNYVERQSSRKFCATVVLVNDAYRQQPPTSDLGRQLAKDYEQLRSDLHCD